MINIVVPRRYWQLNVLGDCDHFLLAILNLVLILCLHHGERLGVDHAVLLRRHHALLLDLRHCVLRGLMLLLHHFLEDLLVGDGCECYLRVHRVVVFLLVREHFYFSSS